MKKFLASGVAGILSLSFAMPAFAAPVKPEIKKAATVDVACMQAAIEKRDTAIVTSLTSFTSALTASLQTRKDALKAAWALTDATQRNNAIKAAWAAFNGTWKKGREALNTGKKTAWKTFRTDAKTCKQPEADSSGEQADGNL